MSLKNFQAVFIMAGFLVLAACASTGGNYGQAPSPHYKIGKPYQVKGKWYHPAHDPGYDKVGVASWYGRDFHGMPTANGEVFNMNGLTAAHTTLPLPSMVRVENLDNGRSIVVRVNDRGPFVGNRIIDMSREAARRLGFEHQGTARVRVRYLGPAPLPGGPTPPMRETMPETRVAVHSEPAPQPVKTVTLAALETPTRTDAQTETVLPRAEPPAAIPAGPAAGPSANAAPSLYIIRIAALSQPDNIERVRTALAHIGPLRMARVDLDNGGAVYRINMGPYAEAGEAAQRLEAVREAGYADARIVTLAP